MKLRKWVLGILFMFAFGLFLLKAPWFYVQDVTVKGCKFTPVEDVHVLLAPYYGHSIFIPLLTDSLSAKLRLTFPQCQAIKIRPASLNRLIVTVEEKKPWASFWVDGRTILVASDGSVLGASDADMSEYPELLIIRGFPDMYFQDKHIPEDFVVHIHDVLSRLKHFLPGASFQLQFQDRYNWIILYQDTLPIYIGTIKNLDDKFQRLQSFLGHYQNQNEAKPIEYIDLRADNKILVKYGETL